VDLDMCASQGVSATEDGISLIVGVVQCSEGGEGGEGSAGEVNLTKCCHAKRPTISSSHRARA